jgi:sec-independent protein translocase protein TatC
LKRRKSNPNELPLLGHLKELRKVLLVIAYAVAGGAIVGWALAPTVLSFMEMPVVNMLDVSFISLGPLEKLMVKLKLSMVIGVLIMAPVIFWQIWSFLLPALKRSEKKNVYFAVPWSVVLFLGGAAFCFFVVMPLSLNFFVSMSQEGIDTQQMYSIKTYVDFVLRFVLAFGLVFQLPLVLLLLMKLGVLNPKTLIKFRRYAIFFIVLAAVIISPTPDLWTLALMILPMYLLYEVSIWVGVLMLKRKRKEEGASP